MTESAATLTGIASGSMAMGGGFLTAFTAPGEDAANAGLFVGVAGVVGTILSSVTPWVREWFQDRKEERAFRRERLEERLQEALDDLAELKADQRATRGKIAANEGRLDGQQKAFLDAGFTPSPDLADDPDAPPPRRVLVVEDDPDTTRAITRRLAVLGFAADYAYTAPEAIRRLSERPDFVVLDLSLGEGSSGLDVLAAIKKHCPTCWVAVTTGDALRLDEARAAGADLALVKEDGWLDRLTAAIGPDRRRKPLFDDRETDRPPTLPRNPT